MSVHLSPRQSDCLRLFADGGTFKTVARDLGISPNSVKTHRRFLLAKLQARSMPQAIALAFRLGLLEAA